MIGKVLEVFIPNEYKNGMLLDVLDSNKIGFKIMVDNRLIEVIQKQDDENVKIMRNDMVIVREQNVSGKHFIDISLVEGENYE